jgi:hypothetical protein
VPDVRRYVVDLGVAVDERGLHALGRRTHERHATITMVIVAEHRELLLADKERRHAVARALGDVRKRMTRCT